MLSCTCSERHVNASCHGCAMITLHTTRENLWRTCSSNTFQYTTTRMTRCVTGSQSAPATPSSWSLMPFLLLIHVFQQAAHGHISKLVADPVVHCRCLGKCSSSQVKGLLRFSAPVTHSARRWAELDTFVKFLFVTNAPGSSPKDLPLQDVALKSGNETKQPCTGSSMSSVDQDVAAARSSGADCQQTNGIASSSHVSGAVHSLR